MIFDCLVQGGAAQVGLTEVDAHISHSQTLDTKPEQIFRPASQRGTLN
jgi:hypothetical protein